MDARENGCSPAVRVRVSQGEGGSDRGEWYYALGGVVGHGVAGVGGERGRVGEEEMVASNVHSTRT